MLELIFVIVIIGIMSALIIPRMNRDTRMEAANQLVTHIKYTQHLAMTEDQYDDQLPNWFLRRWKIQFYACGGYVIHSDRNMLGGAPARANAALEPQTRKAIFIDNLCTMPMPATDYEKVNLAGYFDVANITFVGCGGQFISFDTLGRPYNANAINGVLQQNCEVTLNFNSGTPETIRIHPETGYSCILDRLNTPAPFDCL